MKRITTQLAALSLGAVVASGCGTIIGGAGGAAAGAGAAAAMDKDVKKGALIGAGIGVAAGAIYDITKD